MIKTKAVIDIKLGQDVVIDEIIIDDPKPEEVVVKICSSGICGSQLLNLQHPQIYRPQLLGHEAIGTVLQIGKEIKHLQEGDKVIVSWLPFDPTEETEYIKWCEIKWNSKILKSIIFTWTEHTVVHNQFVSKIPEDLDKYSGSLIGCAVATGAGSVNNIGNVKSKHSVAVFGAGGLGMFAINAARIVNAHPIIAVDIDDRKLKLASEIGASHIINSKQFDPVEKIHEITNGGADYVYDMVGIPSVMVQTIESSKEGVLGYSQGGTIVLAGFPHSSRDFNPRSLINGQRTYIGSKGGFSNPKVDFPKYYQLNRDGYLPLEKVVTNRYQLDQINLAINDLANGKILGRGIIEIN